MERIKSYLEEKNMNYHIRENEIAERENEIVLPYLINEKKFHITIQFHNKWIIVSSLIAKKDQIPKEKYSDMMKELLIANHELPEINYDISRKGDIFTSVDMRLDIVDFENFFSEFFAVIFGIKRFIEKIAPSLDINITDFA